MKFPPSFLEEIRDRLPVSQVVGRRVRLKKAGREWVGLSPFNKERTPSFYANDAKGRWFDHSAGKDGDVFAFVMETEGLTFPEAVERLAGEAGVPMPKPDPEIVKREARRLGLLEIADYAFRFFRQALTQSGEGAPARDYLGQRGISSESMETFGIGYAPASGSALLLRLKADGIDLPSALLAGVLTEREDGTLRDRFVGRVIFPIRDLKGRVCGFGGRGLAPDAKPKYLNSNEGPIFDKGSLLYNAHAARQPAHDGATAVALEGYMDVVASTAAGFPASVATMGTSITEAQLLGLWRLSDDPVVALDGDAAGQRAAGKLIRLALPLIKADRTLRFALMPTGADPDDVVRKRGAGAYRALIEHAIPLVDMIWRVGTSGRSLATPDDRAAAIRAMEEVVDTIPDDGLRDEYRRDLRDRMRSVPTRPAVVRANGGTFHSASPSSQRLVHGIDLGNLTLKESMTVAAMVRDPSAALDAAETLLEGRMSPAARDAMRRIVDILVDLGGEGDVLAALQAAGLGSTVDAAYARLHGAGVTSLDPDADPAAARAILKRH